MHRGMAILLAFAATVSIVPLLALLMDMVWRLPPLPRTMMFSSTGSFYFVAVISAFVAAVPGFAIFRLGLWWLRSRMLVSFALFALAGAITGTMAAVLLCFPGYLWVLGRYDLLAQGATIGALAGLVQRSLEELLFNRFGNIRGSVISGDAGS